MHSGEEQNAMNWFRKRREFTEAEASIATARPKIPPPAPVPFPVGMTLDKWLSNPDLAIRAKALFEDELTKMIFGVLQNSIPSGWPARGQVVNDTTANIELGRIQGYMDCLNLLNLLGTPAPVRTEVPLDWNAEEEE